MKRLFLVYLMLLAAGLLPGCISRYTYTEEVPETTLLRRVEVKKTKAGNTERITENHLLTDSVSGITDSKEIHRFLTRKGKTRELSHKNGGGRTTGG